MKLCFCFSWQAESRIQSYQPVGHQSLNVSQHTQTELRNCQDIAPYMQALFKVIRYACYSLWWKPNCTHSCVEPAGHTSLLEKHAICILKVPQYYCFLGLQNKCRFSHELFFYVPQLSCGLKQCLSFPVSAVTVTYGGYMKRPQKTPLCVVFPAFDVNC